MENHQPLAISCVGFIMDGNRRFARAQNQPEGAGHIAGKEKFIEVANWVAEAGIPHAVFYTFSTENWKRHQVEIELIISLLLLDLHNRIKAKIKVIGQREDFPSAVQENIAKQEEASLKHNYQTTIWVALSYGGRSEILAAVNKAIALGEPVSHEQFANLLWTKAMPDPDLIIRTGGEQRLSNFLPWQSAYSELFFTPTLWPAFTKGEFQRILSDYAHRERRIGK